MRRLFTCFLLLASLAACAHGQISIKTVTVPTARVDGVDIGYRITGQGPPLLMIMGYAGTMDVWDPVLVQTLAKTHTVITFDNRNIGYSSTAPEKVTISLMAHDALGLLKALGISRADVFGWSMGSIIAQEMALEHPEAVGKLVLYGTAFEREPVMEAIKSFDGLAPEQFAAKLFPKAWVEQNADIYSRLQSPVIPAKPEAIARQRQALAEWSGSGNRLSSLQNDVLVVVGEDDAITPLAQSLAVVSKVKGAWLVRFRGAGHWLMYQSPDGLAAVTETFLSGRQNLIR